MAQHTCPDCGIPFGSSKTLATHRQKAHPDKLGHNFVACIKTIRFLRERGRIDPVDWAFVEAVRGLAKQLDADPTNAQMWRTYLEAWAPLLSDERSDDFEDLKSKINSAAPVGDTPKT